MIAFQIQWEQCAMFRSIVTFGVLVCGIISALLVGGSASAQADVNITYWGYFSPDASIVLTLGELTSDNPALAAELVSPQYAGDFFEGFTSFTNYDFASLSEEQYSQVSGADEYMVFDGDYEGSDGIKPGYLAFLSVNQKVFVIFGYQEHAEPLFGLMQQTIVEGQAPETFQDYMRINVNDLSGGETSSTGNGYSDEVGRTFCANDPMFAPFDLNGDNYVTQFELSTFSGLSNDLDQLLATMVENNFDSIQVSGCTPAS